MELLDAFNGWGTFFIVFGAVTVFGLVIGGIGSALESDVEPLVAGLTIGAILGVVFGLIFAGSAYDGWKADTLDTFENTYQVSVIEGSIPRGPDDQSSVLMYTQNGGPLACIISTDDVEYTVVCDGEELRPVNVK